jgi:hypothetical protein
MSVHKCVHLHYTTSLRGCVLGVRRCVGGPDQWSVPYLVGGQGTAQPIGHEPLRTCAKRTLRP